MWYPGGYHRYVPDEFGPAGGTVGSQRSSDRDQPTDKVRVPVFDRLLLVALSAFFGGLFFGVLSILVTSWETFNRFLLVTLLGQPMDDTGTNWKLILLVAVGIGIVAGGWGGWQLGRSRRRRHRTG